jgi:hypothetical protein
MAQKSEKQQQIDKTMDNMFTIAGVAIFITIFCLFSAHNLWTKLVFQNHVITAKTTAKNQLNADVSAATQLTSSYENFNQSQTNLLGAQASGVDNDNAKVVLDSLPSSYDYPALITSLQILLSNQGVTIDSIGGSDQSATQGATAAPATSAPATSTTTTPSSDTAVAMPFTFSVNGPYTNVQNVITAFEKSIRPFQILSMNVSGDQSNVSLNVSAQTFYQPATTFNITQESIK